jgi:hypothetical protein
VTRTEIQIPTPKEKLITLASTLTILTTLTTACSTYESKTSTYESTNNITTKVTLNKQEITPISTRQRLYTTGSFTNISTTIDTDDAITIGISAPYNPSSTQETSPTYTQNPLKPIVHFNWPGQNNQSEASNIQYQQRVTSGRTLTHISSLIEGSEFEINIDNPDL